VYFTLDDRSILFSLSVEGESGVDTRHNLTLILGCLYWQGRDGVLRLCIEPYEKKYYLQTAHVVVGGLHMAGDQTLQRVLWEGLWWPTHGWRHNNAKSAMVGTMVAYHEIISTRVCGAVLALQHQTSTTTHYIVSCVNSTEMESIPD